MYTVYAWDASQEILFSANFGNIVSAKLFMQAATHADDVVLLELEDSECHVIESHDVLQAE